MDKIGPLRCLRILCLCFTAFYIALSDAARLMHQFRAAKHFTNINSLRKLDTFMPLDSSNSDPYISSPFSSPPYEALPPFTLAENTPPFCVYPPSTPQPPSTIPTPTPPPSSTTPALTPIPPTPEAATTPTPPDNPPTIDVPTPPDVVLTPPTYVPTPPDVVPNPPTYVPTPTEPVFSPPSYYEPSPPSYYEPSPPSYAPGPPPQSISPPSRFLPPIVFPPPAVPPPPHRTPVTAMWCVAKAAVPDPIIQEAMNYACFSGAECDEIQPSGSCFQPDTLFAHASYAFNSYWQRTKKAGGSCDFGGTAILVTVDPSYDGCSFVYL